MAFGLLQQGGKTGENGFSAESLGERMRKLFLFVAAFAAADALAVYALPHKALCIVALCALAAAFAIHALPKRPRLRLRLVLVGLAFGLVWTWGYDTFRVSPGAQLDGEQQEVTARAVSYTTTYADYSLVTLRLTTADGYHCKARVYDRENLLPSLEPGDEIRGTFTLRDAGVRRGEETENYLSRGIVLLAYPKGKAERIGSWKHSWVYTPQRIAHRLSEQAAGLWANDVSPLIRGVLLGDRTALQEQTAVYDGICISGIAHIVAVSGFHVSILVAVLCLLVVDARKRALIGMPLVGLFCLVTGAGAPVLRAGLMQCILLLAPLARRESDQATSLSAAAFLLLLLNPHAIAGVSFQLSFAATAGIFLAATPIQNGIVRRLTGEKKLRSRWLKKLLWAGSGIVAVSISVQIFSAPLMAAYFGYLSLYSFLSNLLCMWMLTIAFVLSWAVLLLSLVFPGLAALLGSGTAWTMRYILAVSEKLAQLPHSALYTENRWVLFWLALVYLVFIIALLTGGKRGFQPWVPAGVSCIMLCAVLLFGMRAEPSVNVLDIGQGLCTAVLTQKGTVVVDCGGNRDGGAGKHCAAYLGARGRERIDALILTHLHADHANGVEDLLARVQVEHLFLPPEEDSALRSRILQLAREQGTSIHEVSQDIKLHLDSLSMTVFAPLEQGDANESGLSCLGAMGEFDFLITGDMQEGTEFQLVGHSQLPQLDLLVVGHHGSAASTGRVLLSQTQPAHAAISVGYNNYGHPAEETLQRLQEWRIPYYRTDNAGDITFRLPEADA